MTGLAADLTDRVIPFVPVRQFVLSVPHRVRYLLAYDHARCIAVLRIFVRALLSFYRERARQRGVRDGRTGSVTFVQQFGSAANLNMHGHVVVLDGVFAEADDGTLVFHAAASPTEAELSALIATVRTRILRYLEFEGVQGDDDGPTDPLHDQAPALASCYAGSIAGRQTLGRRRHGSSGSVPTPTPLGSARGAVAHGARRLRPSRRTHRRRATPARPGATLPAAMPATTITAALTNAAAAH